MGSEPATLIDRLGRVRVLRSLQERWEEKVDRDGPIPEHAPSLGRCWVWTGAIFGGPRGGYGMIKRGGAGSKDAAPAPAHVVAYEFYVGPIPEGLRLDHLCENRACVNPAHLEPVTHQENILRGFAARRRRQEQERAAA